MEGRREKRINSALLDRIRRETHLSRKLRLPEVDSRRAPAFPAGLPHTRETLWPPDRFRYCTGYTAHTNKRKSCGSQYVCRSLIHPSARECQRGFLSFINRQRQQEKFPGPHVFRSVGNPVTSLSTHLHIVFIKKKKRSRTSWHISSLF